MSGGVRENISTSIVVTQWVRTKKRKIKKRLLGIVDVAIPFIQMKLHEAHIKDNE